MRRLWQIVLTLWSAMFGRAPLKGQNPDSLRPKFRNRRGTRTFFDLP
jgi:hypothetical protein